MPDDTKPAREPLILCPRCQVLPTEYTSQGYFYLGCAVCGCMASHAFKTKEDSRAAWNRRITREPAAPVGDDVLADAVKWARDAADRYERYAASLTSNLGNVRSDAQQEADHLNTLATAASRAPTEAQRREIAEAWSSTFGDEALAVSMTEGSGQDSEGSEFTERLDRIEAALRAAGIIGGEHD